MNIRSMIKHVAAIITAVGMLLASMAGAVTALAEDSKPTTAVDGPTKPVRIMDNLYQTRYTGDYKLDDYLSANAGGNDDYLAWLRANLNHGKPIPLSTTQACTTLAVTDTDTGHDLMVRNMDWYPAVPGMMVATAPTDGYRSVGVAPVMTGKANATPTTDELETSANIAPLTTMDGVNEKGLSAVVAFTAFQRAQSEFTGNNRRLPVPLCCVLDEAANICRWPELADVYSYFGSAGIPIMTIWQNLATIPGTLYKIRLKHASLCKDNVDQMQVVINGTPIEMTRVTANGKAGDKVGEKSTTIGTRVTNENRWHHSDQWETYEGYYVIPDGQTTTRFGFKAVNYLDPTKGNLLDDVTFARAYKLSYDKNASDATGSVPSNQRGKENTVQPAEARGTGTVKTVADGDSSKSLTVNPGFDVPDYSKLNDGGLHWMYVNPAEGKAWSYYDYINPAQPVQQVAGLSQATFGWQELTGGDHKTTAFELHREKDGNVCADVHGSRTIGQTIDTQAGVAYTVSIRHSGRSKGNAGSVQVLVGPDRDHLRPLEMSRMNVSRTGAKYGDRIGSVGTVVTTHSDSVDSTEGDHPAWDHADDWETYSGTYVATGGKTVFAYRGVDKNGDSVIDDLSFKLAYRLTYDKNAQDAAGSVPSSQYGKENTVQPAKAKTTGSVRLAADKTASGLTVHDLKNGEIAPVQYGDFKFSTVNGFSADQVTNVNGFTVKTNSNPFWEALYTDGTSTAYFPTKNGASLVLHHVGQWRDSSGTQRWLNARITVNGQNLGFLYYEAPTHHFNIGYGKWDKKPSSRPYMDVTVDFLLDDGSTPQGLRGVTGFTDLDGGTSGYNEGVELVSGFDGAYVRSDAHLTRFGTNGWAGTTDENAEVADEHGMKHYVGATFTGSSFRVR